MIHVPGTRIPYVPHPPSRHRERESDEFAIPMPLWFVIGAPLVFVLALAYFLHLSEQIAEQRKQSS